MPRTSHLFCNDTTWLWPCRHDCGKLVFAAAVTTLFGVLLLGPATVRGQTPLSQTSSITEDMKSRLVKKGKLTLRDANLVEALFAIRRTWGINVVVGNELKGETVSCEFDNAPLHEILDAILAPRGYGYKPVGNSLVVVSLDEVGDLKPLFDTAIIPIRHAEANEVLAAVQFYLSRNGKIQAVPSSKCLVIIDFPDRIEFVTKRAEELDEASRKAVAAAKAAQNSNGTGGSESGSSTAGSISTTGATSPLRIAYFKPQFVKAETLRESLSQLLSLDGKIAAIPRDNRLVVSDWPARLEVIADAVKQLDLPRPQVRISVLIYDAALEDMKRLGVNWRTGGKGNNLATDGTAQDQVTLNSITTVPVPATATNGALTFTTLGSNFDLSAVVHALGECKDSRLLADPNVTVVDQEPAKIEIVKEIPYQQLTQGINGGTIGTTAFREAGISLSVTPQVSDDGTIALLVNPRFSVLAGFTQQSNQPIIDRRETSTSVRVRDCQTLVIGGLKQRNSNHNGAGVPYLQDMKWGLGHLFRSKDWNNRESELVVFITPHVLPMDYVGSPREIDISNGGPGELDAIGSPNFPIAPRCRVPGFREHCGCREQNCNGCPTCAPDPYGSQPYTSPQYPPQYGPEYAPQQPPQEYAVPRPYAAPESYPTEPLPSANVPQPPTIAPAPTNTPRGVPNGAPSEPPSRANPMLRGTPPTQGDPAPAPTDAGRNGFPGGGVYAREPLKNVPPQSVNQQLPPVRVGAAPRRDLFRLPMSPETQPVHYEAPPYR